MIDFVSVDLNALMLHLEQVIAKTRKLNKDIPGGQPNACQSFEREAAINTYCWDKQLNYYTDYNFKTHEQNDVISPAGMYPFCILKKTPLLNQKCLQATAILKKKLLQPGGVTTTEYNNNQQWDALMAGRRWNG